MNEKMLEKNVHEFVQHNRDAIIEDLRTLIAVNSVEGEPQENAPFGAGPRRALDEAMKIAERMGFKGGHTDYRLCWAELKGEKEDYLATITHLDVVPAGPGWDADPFTLRIRDGWLLGRGVADDKGPAVLCLYALKYLKESGIPLRYSVRALMGCNEETGMEDIPAYLAKEKPPVFCFTPDAEFPVCNGEKGHYIAKIISEPMVDGRILNWNGGLVDNAVPGDCTALVQAAMCELPEDPHIEREETSEGVRLTAHGKTGHAAMPQGTVNAIGLLVEYLLKNNICTPQEKEFLLAIQKLHCSTAGDGLGIACCDGRFDPLTIIGGTMRTTEEHRFIQGCDSRYPTCTNGEELTKALQEAVGDIARVEVKADDVPFYISAESAPIRILIDTYNQVTSSDEKPFTMGGGTYARHFPLAVSFGPEYPGMELPPFGGPMHGANEAAPLEGLLKALEIYIIALVKLENTEF